MEGYRRDIVIVSPKSVFTHKCETDSPLSLTLLLHCVILWLKLQGSDHSDSLCSIVPSNLFG